MHFDYWNPFVYLTSWEGLYYHCSCSKQLILLRLSSFITVCVPWYNQRLFILRTYYYLGKETPCCNCLQCIYYMCLAFDEHPNVNDAVVSAALVLRRTKAHVLLYFTYLEGHSLTFPHPCVLCDHFLSSICE